MDRQRLSGAHWFTSLPLLKAYCTAEVQQQGSCSLDRDDQSAGAGSGLAVQLLYDVWINGRRMTGVQNAVVESGEPISNIWRSSRGRCSIYTAVGFILQVQYVLVAEGMRFFGLGFLHARQDHLHMPTS